MHGQWVRDVRRVRSTERWRDQKRSFHHRRKRLSARSREKEERTAQERANASFQQVHCCSGRDVRWLSHRYQRIHGSKQDRTECGQDETTFARMEIKKCRCRKQFGARTHNDEEGSTNNPLQCTKTGMKVNHTIKPVCNCYGCWRMETPSVRGTLHLYVGANTPIGAYHAPCTQYTILTRSWI